MKVIETNKGALRLPCMQPIIVPIEKLRANNYNPNAVDDGNMKLLETSIMTNGFCFPIVTIFDPNEDAYVIIDGFHRYSIFKDYLKAKEIPIVVLEHTIEQRMSATVQFNRARGVHQVELMGSLVKSLIEQGVDEVDVCEQLGMDIDEVHRLKQITGIAELFKNQPYSKSWEAQID